MNTHLCVKKEFKLLFSTTTQDTGHLALGNTFFSVNGIVMMVGTVLSILIAISLMAGLVVTVVSFVVGIIGLIAGLDVGNKQPLISCQHDGALQSRNDCRSLPRF